MLPLNTNVFYNVTTEYKYVSKIQMCVNIMLLIQMCLQYYHSIQTCFIKTNVCQQYVTTQYKCAL